MIEEPSKNLLKQLEVTPFCLLATLPVAAAGDVLGRSPVQGPGSHSRQQDHRPVPGEIVRASLFEVSER